MPSNHLNLCRPLLLPSIFPSIRVFSNEYSGLILFKIDWFDLLDLQRTLHHHTLKASILQHSAFFIVQLSHPYMTTGKTIALTLQIFVGKVISLLFNMLSRFVTAGLSLLRPLFYLVGITVPTGQQL